MVSCILLLCSNLTIKYTAMKKINPLLIGIMAIASMIALPSCQSTKTATAVKMLKFNFEKGKGYDYEMIMNMDQEIMGKSMQMDMSAYYSMDVTADSGDTKTITTSVDRFKMKMDIAGLNIDVDTDKPETGNSDMADEKKSFKIMNRVFDAIKGRRFSMKVDAEGKVLEVTGFENMAKTIADSMNLDEEKRQEMMQQFNKQFNANNIKQQFERVWYIFPNKEVKVGSTWQKNTDIGGPMGGKYNSTYKVIEIEGDMVTLQETTQIESDNEKMKLNGEVTGTLVVDSRIGLVVNADQEIKITAGGEGMTFEIKGKTKIKGKVRQ